QIIATEISPTNTKVGDTLDVKITVKNTSDKPLQTMGPAPGFTYVQGQTYFTQQFASEPGKWRVAIGTAGLDATDLPYRWGLGGDWFKIKLPDQRQGWVAAGWIVTAAR